MSGRITSVLVGSAVGVAAVLAIRRLFRQIGTTEVSNDEMDSIENIAIGRSLLLHSPDGRYIEIEATVICDRDSDDELY